MILSFERDGQIVKQLDLKPGCHVFGRGKRANICILDANISREHVKLTIDDQGIWLEDLGSFNGTLLNGERLSTSAELKAGDHFTLGPFTCSIEGGPEDSDATRPDLMIEPSPYESVIFFSSQAQDTLPDDPTLPPSDKPDLENSQAFLSAISVRSTDDTKKPQAVKDKHAQGSAPPQRLAESIPAVIDDDPSSPTVADSGTLPVIDEPPTEPTLSVDEERPTDPSEEEEPKTKILSADEGEHTILASDTPSSMDDDSSERSTLSRVYVAEKTKIFFKRNGFQVGLLIVSVLTGLGVVAFVKSKRAPLPDSLPQRAPMAQKTPIAPPTTKTRKTPSSPHQINVHLEKARDAIASHDYAIAQNHLSTILEDLDPANQSARELWVAMKTSKEAHAKAMRKEKTQALENAKQLQALMTEADKHLLNRDYKKAKAVYLKAEKIADDPKAIQLALSHLDHLMQEQRKEKVALRKHNEQMRRIYAEAVTKYELGALGESEALLGEIIKAKKSRYTQKARALMGKIQKALGSNLRQEIADIRNLSLSMPGLPEAYERATRIRAEFPARKDVRDVYSDIAEAMRTQARQLYAQALAEEELGSDLTQALELYRQTLRYAPDASEPYHQKALKKIKALESKTRP